LWFCQPRLFFFLKCFIDKVKIWNAPIVHLTFESLFMKSGYVTTQVSYIYSLLVYVIIGFEQLDTRFGNTAVWRSEKKNLKTQKLTTLL